MSDFLLYVLILMFAIPITTYLTVKLGRYAYLRAGQIFQRDNQPPTTEGVPSNGSTEQT